MSIPGTVSRALKYIPELQKEVDILKRKKEKLSSHPSASTRKEHLGIKEQSTKVSVNILGDKEVVIQLISPTDHMTKNKNYLSNVLEHLEQEDGFVFENATDFKRLGEGMKLSTLHLQVHIQYSVSQFTY
ncbi:hypothetical protein HanLR1_Chr00c0890g0779791 [Helianthus annuus]|uniref:Putative achaete-scute transcription factor-related protein n=1 Tax=Helianthus annuus TaxID=4232 RepID=A0A251SRE3_HELAN|nr:hypothetical protein HanLR1_Chr00c0890g0779791 [Helianthus annuus]